MQGQLADKATTLGTVLSDQASVMGTAWDAMLVKLQALQLRLTPR